MYDRNCVVSYSQANYVVEDCIKCWRAQGSIYRYERGVNRESRKRKSNFTHHNSNLNTKYYCTYCRKDKVKNCIKLIFKNGRKLEKLFIHLVLLRPLDVAAHFSSNNIYIINQKFHSNF